MHAANEVSGVVIEMVNGRVRRQMEAITNRRPVDLIRLNIGLEAHSAHFMLSLIDSRPKQTTE